MPCQLCVIFHAAHLAWAFIWVLNKGDAQDARLVSALTLYSMMGYIIVGLSTIPVAHFSFVQILVSASFLFYSQRFSGNITGVMFALLAVIGGLSIIGLFPGEIWEGISFNYWNISAIVLHIAILISWTRSNDKDVYIWLLN